MPSNQLTVHHRQRREWRCVWCLQPIRHNLQEVTFVDACTQSDAEKLLTDHIERTTGVASYRVLSITEVSDLPEGGIVR